MKSEIVFDSNKFVVFSLPRSRSAWFAHFLRSDGQFKIGHDIALQCEKTDDFISAFRDYAFTGTVETGAVMAWKLILHEMPKVQFMTIRRPLKEVKRSLNALGLEPQKGDLETKELMLDIVEKLPRTIRVEFSTLSEWSVCSFLYEKLLGVECQFDWWQRMSALNIQIDMRKRIVQLLERAPQMEQLKREVTLKSLTLPSGIIGLQ